MMTNEQKLEAEALVRRWFAGVDAQGRPERLDGRRAIPLAERKLMKAAGLATQERFGWFKLTRAGAAVRDAR